MILSFLFYSFLAYLLFRLVFNFIIPIYRTTQKVKRGFREMNERMSGYSTENQYQQAGTKASATSGFSGHGQQPTTGNLRPEKDEYLEFEEIKE